MNVPTVPAPPPVLEAEGRPTVPWRPPETLLRYGMTSRRPAPPSPPPRRRRSRIGVGVALAVGGAVVLGGVLAVPVADALLGSGSASPAAEVRVGTSAPRSMAVSPPSLDEERAPARRREAMPTEDTRDGDEAVAAAPVVHRSEPTSREPAEPAPPASPPAASDAEDGTAAAPREVSDLREDVLELHRLLPELTAADVQRVVRNQRPRMQRCYDRALRRNGAAQDARLTLTIDVGPPGGVDHVQLVGDDVGALHACLERMARRWHFPPSRGGARVPIPLSFSTRD